MKFTSRVLLGTLAMTAAVSGTAASAHADAPGTGGGTGTAGSSGTADDAGPSTTDALLCPFVTSGPLNTVLNDLNPQSVAGACATPGTNLVTGNKATGKTGIQTAKG